MPAVGVTEDKKSQVRRSQNTWASLPLYLTGFSAIVIVANLLRKARRYMAKSGTCESKQGHRERMAAEMAKDETVLKSVAESRAAYELGKTLTLDQAFPKSVAARKRA